MNAIEKLRTKADLSQVELAEALGITQGAVSQWENGAGFPTSDKLPKLAKLLNCSIDDLYEVEEKAG